MSRVLNEAVVDLAALREADSEVKVTHRIYRIHLNGKCKWQGRQPGFEAAINAFNADFNCSYDDYHLSGVGYENVKYLEVGDCWESHQEINVYIREKNDDS